MVGKSTILPLGIGRRAREILVLLADHQGRVVSRELIVRTVWGSTVVEPNNLEVQIAALRKVLSRGTIRTIYGGGYMLVSEPELATANTVHVDFAELATAGPSPFGQALRRAIGDELAKLSGNESHCAGQLSSAALQAVDSAPAGFAVYVRTLTRRGVKIIHVKLVDQKSARQIWAMRYQLLGRPSEDEVLMLSEVLICSVDREIERFRARSARFREIQLVPSLLREANALSHEFNSHLAPAARDLIYEKILVLDPANPTALAGRAASLVHRAPFLSSEYSPEQRVLMMREGAVLAWDLISSGSREPLAFGAMGSFYCLQGQVTRGLLWDMKRFEVEKWSGPSNLNMAESYVLSALPEKAIELVERFKHLNGGTLHPGSATILGPAYLQRGEVGRAIRVLDAGLGVSGTFQSILFWLAISLARNGAISKAKDYRDELLAIDPKFCRPWECFPNDNHPVSYFNFWREFVSPMAARLGMSDCVID